MDEAIQSIMEAVFGRLPPLSALRAFEAAARTGSFKAAAEELCVTATAVSHQIRSLKDVLGLTLFVRRPRRVELTDVGRALAPAMTRGFLELRDGVQSATERAPVLSVSTTPAFAALRLVPALNGFLASEPELRVEIDTSMRALDLQWVRRIDLAVRYGRGPFHGLHNAPIADESFVALAAPDRFGSEDLDAAAELLETRWQRPTLARVTWQQWFEGRDPPLGDQRAITTYDDELHVLQAAIAGHGIALASTVLAADLVDRGLLRPLEPQRRIPGGSYVAVRLPERSGEAKITSFVEWLQDLFS